MQLFSANQVSRLRYPASIYCSADCNHLNIRKETGITVVVDHIAIIRASAIIHRPILWRQWLSACSCM